MKKRSTFADREDCLECKAYEKEIDQLKKDKDKTLNAVIKISIESTRMINGLKEELEKEKHCTDMLADVDNWESWAKVLGLRDRARQRQRERKAINQVTSD